MSKPNNKKDNRYKGKDREYDRKSSGDRCVTSHIGKPNAFQWYNKHPELINDATKWSFFNQLGAKASLGTSFYKVPGIMAFDIHPYVGSSTDNTSPVSRASVILFENIRKRLNKPTYNYGPADLMIMIVCIASLHMMYADFVRLFGLLGNWQADNLYSPRSVICAAYGYDKTEYQEIVGHLPDYRERFNQLCKFASWLELPSDISIVDRWAWLFENYYRDSKSTKGQTYILSLATAFLWKEDGPTGSTAQRFGCRSNTLSGDLDMFEQCITTLYNSDSVRVMQSDLRNAYRESPSKVFLSIPENWHIEPIQKLDQVLSMIENMRVLPFSYFKNRDITHNPLNDAIICDPILPFDGYAEEVGNLHASTLFNEMPGPWLMNMHWDNPNAEDITEATRLTSAVAVNTESYEGDEQEVMHILNACDIVGGIRIYVDPDDEEMYVLNNTSYLVLTDNGVLDEQAMAFLIYSAPFDWAPTMYVRVRDTVGPLSELDNYTSVTNEMVGQLNTACLLSVWDVPEANR